MLNRDEERNYFIRNLEAFGEKWGTIKKTLFGIRKGWDVEFLSANGFKDAFQQLDSKSVPIEEIFLNKKLQGKTYLVYKYLGRTKLGDLPSGASLQGIIQTRNTIDSKSINYYYIVAQESNILSIGDYDRTVRTSYNRLSVTGGQNEPSKYDIKRYFYNKIWAGCYALDITYLIEHNKFQFLNWIEYNPWQVKE